MAGPNYPYTNLDADQALKQSFQEASDALRTIMTGGSLVPDVYDYIALTYVPSGPGAGEIETVTFKTGGSSGTTVATLTLGYNGSSQLISVARS